MLVLGLILLLLAAGLLIGFLSSGTQQVTFDSGVLDVTVSTLTIYLLGALTLLLIVAGLALMRSGTRRAHQRRKEHKELNRLSKKVEAHEAEKRRDDETGATSTTTTTTGTTTGTTTTQTPPEGTGTTRS
jgi:membrane protein implicated in regulation of membrane protease activity